MTRHSHPSGPTLPMVALIAALALAASGLVHAMQLALVASCNDRTHQAPQFGARQRQAPARRRFRRQAEA